MDFDKGLTLEKIASPYLNEWYQKTFPNLISIIDVSEDKDFQHMGIDKFLAFKQADIIRPILFSIDEKVRNKAWNDVLAEIWSKRENKIPGWVWTCKADYIVYAFFDVSTKKLLQPPAFIPTLDFVKAVKIKDYPIQEAKNFGWTTTFEIIPREELPSKPPQARLVLGLAETTKKEQQP